DEDQLVAGFFSFSSRRRHTRWPRDWSSDVCSSDLVREANESSTSRAVTSTITPRERYDPTCPTKASRSWTRSVSVNADWIEAIRNDPCLRIGTAMAFTSVEVS